MSGVFGVLDPDGPTVEQLQGAVAASSFRGIPEIIVVGPFGLGVLRRHDRDPSLRVTDAAITAADGEVHGFLRRLPAVSTTDASPDCASALDGVLGGRGPSDLQWVAADFAVARLDRAHQRLLLTRDVFGTRPLYIARRGRRVGFACDPAVLMRLGLADGELDAEVIRRHLAGTRARDQRTAFVGIDAIVPGSWVEIDPYGRDATGRWFDAGAFVTTPVRGVEAVERTRSVVEAAASARARSQTRIGVSLSGGIDSAAVTMALARSGSDAVCVSQEFDPDLGVSEVSLAAQVAGEAGFPLVPAFVSSTPSPDDLDRLPDLYGTPIGYGAFLQLIRPLVAARSLGVDVLMTGDGGEPLFSTAEVAILDLLRRGRFRQGASAANTLHRHWGYPYRRLGKSFVRSAAPKWLLDRREHLRPGPPWVPDAGRLQADLISAPRSREEQLVRFLNEPDPLAFVIDERAAQMIGLGISYPLLDMRVIELAVNLDISCTAPIDRPKPTLAAAFLGSLADSRVKMSFAPYYRRFARCLQSTRPDFFGPRSISVREGLVSPGGLGGVSSEQWLVRSLDIAPLELWLRRTLG